MWDRRSYSHSKLMAVDIGVLLQKKKKSPTIFVHVNDEITENNNVNIFADPL